MQIAQTALSIAEWYLIVGILFTFLGVLNDLCNDKRIRAWDLPFVVVFYPVIILIIVRMWRRGELE